MTLRSAVSSFISELFKAAPMIASQAPSVTLPVIPGVGTINVVDTMVSPTQANIPRTWAQAFMGPGTPFAGIMPKTTRDQDAETEPRTFQYLPNINSTITPRISWGLTPFSELRIYAETVPEVSMCLRLLTEEMKAFVPTLVDDNDNEVKPADLIWLTTSPDRVNPFSVWLSRFLYNVLVYDAPAIFKIRGTTSSWVQKVNKGFWVCPSCAQVNYGPRDECVCCGAVIELSKAHPINGRYVVRTGMDPKTGNLLWTCENCGTQNFVSPTLKKRDTDTKFRMECGSCGSPAPLRAVNYLDPFYISANDLEKDFPNAPVTGLRIIDGSTLFALVDERGEQPEPPAPAFTQVIWGTPRMFLNTHQVWYHPRHLRADAPYGRSFIEDSMPAVKLLASLWDYEYEKYQVGNIPELMIAMPPDLNWTPDQILEFEQAFNARMSGSNKERVRARFVPAGVTSVATKEMTFNRDTYDAATNAVRMSVGIPKSEAGEAPEGMMGGKSFSEAMQSAFYRMGLAPLQTFVEGMMNDVIKENGYDGIYFRLKFPTDSLDPEKEETKFSTRFQVGGITRNEYRQGIKMEPLKDEKLGYFIMTPGGKGQDEGGEEGQGGDGDTGGGIPVKGGKGMLPTLGGGKIPIMGKKPVPVFRPIAVKLAKGANSEHDGIMVALCFPKDVTTKLYNFIGSDITGEGAHALPPEEIHMTLAFFGDVGEVNFTEAALLRAVTTFLPAGKFHLSGKINGVGRFLETHLDGLEAIYANFDCPALPSFREGLLSALANEGINAKEDHGFTPHVTLAYVRAGDEPVINAEVIDVIPTCIRVAFGGKNTDLEVLAKVETNELAKHCGVCAEDDQWFGTPVSHEAPALMPKQGANESQIVSIGREGMEQRPAVWKPVSGEKPSLVRWVGGALFRRAEANYLLDRELAPDEDHYLVPVTYLAEVDGELGSVQHYIQGREPRKAGDEYGPEWTEQAAVFDYISGQVDRMKNNNLTHPDDHRRPILIDNDLSFPHDETPKTRIRSTFVEAARGNPISDRMMEQIELVYGNNALWEDIDDCLDDPDAGELARERAKELLRTGIIPEDGNGDIISVIRSPIKVVRPEESTGDDQIEVLKLVAAITAVLSERQEMQR